ncbi:hypothetical protein I4U23_012733 [Adineta vaga]|nr:hypothetical protein I4U23_012733 [Adineta vaga]
MLSCSNNTNVSCLNEGECISDSCICSSLCFVGNRCEIYFNAIDLPFSSAMLEDTSSAQIVYSALLTLLVIIGLINNSIGLVICTRESIRITACGVYLIILLTSGFIRTIFLQTTVLTILGYESPSLRLWSCYANPYMSLALGFTGIWLSVGIAIERVLIECFDMNLYETRRHAMLASLGCFIYSCVTNLPAIFAREFVLSPSGKSLCMYDYISHPTWNLVDRVFSYIHAIVPCTAHLVCTVCILTTIARRKIFIHKNTQPKQRLCHVWFRQLYFHRDFLVPPLFLITCLLPNAIHGHLVVKCVSHSDLDHLRLHILFIFLLHVPSVFVYFLYIYPNESYRKEFRQTWLYRRFCCSFYRKNKKKSQQRYQVPIKSTMSELAVKSSF